MKNAFVLLVLTSMALGSCRKSTNDTTVSDGLVIGYNAELCQCCPGNLIKIGNDTLLFERFPPSTPKFVKPYPYRVNLEWQRDTSFCGQVNNRLIVVSKIEIL